MKPSYRKRLLLPAAALFAVWAQQTAFAGDSGSFELIAIQIHDYTTLEHAGRTVTAGPLQGAASIVATSGAPFCDGTNYRATCVVYVKRQGAGIDLEAPCTMADEAGDVLYLLSERRTGNIAAGGGGTGNFQILGGTGKYAGIVGDCPYTTSYLPGKWVVTRPTCTWRKP